MNQRTTLFQGFFQVKSGEHFVIESAPFSKGLKNGGKNGDQREGGPGEVQLPSESGEGGG
jgi:hypothetical protein